MFARHSSEGAVATIVHALRCAADDGDSSFVITRPFADIAEAFAALRRADRSFPLPDDLRDELLHSAVRAHVAAHNAFPATYPRSQIAGGFTAFCTLVLLWSDTIQASDWRENVETATLVGRAFENDCFNAAIAVKLRERSAGRQAVDWAPVEQFEWRAAA